MEKRKYIHDNKETPTQSTLFTTGGAASPPSKAAPAADPVKTATAANKETAVQPAKGVKIA